MRVQDYALAPPSVRNLEVMVPDSFNWGFDVVDKRGREQPSRRALVLARDEGEGIECSFRDVSRKSSQLANYLAGEGLTKGDPVLLMLPKAPMLWLSVVALIKHPSVVESAVVQIPDPVRGAVVKAYVVLRKGYALS